MAGLSKDQLRGAREPARCTRCAATERRIAARRGHRARAGAQRSARKSASFGNAAESSSISIATAAAGGARGDLRERAGMLTIGL
jgi:hypothetical protein